jgi:transcriptional regulator with XRE-family HTH domain
MSELPAWFWESDEVTEAAAQAAPGTLIALARQAHGLSQAQLGALCGFSQSAISRLEANGNLAYDLRVLRSLRPLLGIPAHLLGLAERPRHGRERDGAGTGTRIAAAIEAGGVGGAYISMDADTSIAGTPLVPLLGWDEEGPVDPDLVRRLLVVRRLINEADNALGPRSLTPSVAAMYERIDQMRRMSSGGLRRKLLDVTALYAEFYGWLCQEHGDLRGAGDWTQRALQQAQAAEDRELVAYSYIRLAQLAAVEFDDDRVIGLARAAQREGELSVRVRALALQTEAQGHALAGDTRACMRALDEARVFDVPAAHLRSDEYRVGFYIDQDHLVTQHAACLLELGQAREALASYEEYPESRERLCVWGQAVHVAKMARAYALSGDLDQASALGARALELGQSTGSALVKIELRRLSPWSNVLAIARIARGAGQLV